MAKFSFQVITRPPFKQVGHKFRAAMQKMHEQRRESMRVLGHSLVSALQREAPRKTGKFAGSHTFKTFDRGDSTELRVYVPKPLGDWIRFGTPAHAIVAHGRVLAFEWPRMGAGTFFFKRVWHPDTKPNRYDLRAFQKWRPGAIVELRKMGRAFVMNLGR